MKKLRSKINAVIMAVVIALSMLGAMPVLDTRAEEQVRVIIENTVFSVASGAAWEGGLYDGYVEYTDGMTMADAIALVDEAEADIDITGEDSGFVTEVNGLGTDAQNAGQYSGWMVSCNDWMTDVGISEVTLEAGDEVCVMYSCNMGEDIGCSWGNSDKSLKQLDVKSGADDIVLTPSFASNIYEYSAELEAGTEAVAITPYASNKNYQVKIFVEATEYKRNSSIPVTDGMSIVVECGNPDWPSMNGQEGEAKKYTIKLSIKAAGELDITDALEKTGSYINSNTEGAFGYEWNLIGLSRNGLLSNSVKEAYIESLKATLDENEGVLSKTKYTEYSRTILALTAMGINPADFYGYNLLARLAEFENVNKQGINGSIYALIALDTNKYEIPDTTENVKATRDMYINTILESELESGGWALWGSTTDPDITAMAIQGLAPYVESNENVKAAVDRAVDALSTLQNSEGGFTSWGSVSSETVAQVVIALTNIGINPHTDSRFVKNDNSLMDSLMTFYIADGGFMHVSGGAVNAMASQQSYLALTAYDRMLKEKTKLYDMSDITDVITVPQTPEIPELPEGVSLEAGGIYVVGYENNVLTAGLVTNKPEGVNLLYSWYATKDNGKHFITVSDWTKNNEWINWSPEEYGDYVLMCKVKIEGHDETEQAACVAIAAHPYIKGICQMPAGEGNGYLIGLETYDNKDYSYEMLILDCSLLEKGENAWIFSTGLCKSEANCMWTSWNPKYGYYWTLFRVYDKNGKLIDEICYGFQNI